METKYNCGHCQKTFSCRSHLKRHSKGNHEKKGKHEEILFEELSNKTGEYVEYEESRKKTSINKKIRKGIELNCRICDKKFTRSGTLLRHKKYAHSESNYKCKICDQTFTQSGTIKKHMKYAHIRSTNYKCDECGKVYKWQESLLYHRRVHKSLRNTEEKRHTEDKLHTEGERNNDAEIHTEEEKNNKEDKHTEKARKSVERRTKQRTAKEDNYIKERRTSQDEKIKCFTCGVFSDNSKLYQKHLSSQMHKAFSMIIDLT